MKSVIIILISLIMVISSCSELLEETPKSFISGVNFYQDEADAEGAIAGAYEILNRDQYHIDWLIMVFLHADYANGRGSQAPITVYDQLLNSTNIGRASYSWEEIYRGVNRANAVLENVPKINDISEPARKRILAEAHFLRAFHYFNLVRAFGAVPLKVSESKDLSALSAPRVSESKIYDFIIEEAKFAEQGLPYGYPDASSQTARASVWAAKMLLAQVYLTTEQWDLARDKANEVIESDNFSLVKVSEPDDFYDIFGEGLHTNPEDIMSVHNTETSQSAIPDFLHTAGSPWSAEGGYFAWLPEMNSFLGSWDENDLRKDFNLYTEYIDGDGNTVQLPSTRPILFKKWTNINGLYSMNFPLFRYTEAFLIYAEAASQANGGPSTLALERLNMIKRRAYGYDPETVSPVDFSDTMNAQQFRDTVLQERAYEFVLEGRRWWDLKRTGTAKEVIESAKGTNFLNERLLWPIPEDEINNNPEINQQDQNPGY